MYSNRDVNSVRKLSLDDRKSTLLDDGSARSPIDKERDMAAEKSSGGLSPALSADTKKKAVHYVVDKDKDNNDALFFSSGSNSSDSNSSLFSDHDSIPLPTAKTRSSCFLPPKPIRTKTTLTLTKTEQGHEGEGEWEEEDDVVPKSTTKSRALKMYAHLKKMKQPISPGMKLTTFINSILHNSKSKRGEPTTPCSSATSFSRSRASYINQQTTPSPLKLKRDDETRPDSSKVQIRRAADDDEGSSSCASSDCSEDLFEIDHLKPRFTTERGGGELPAYQTTSSRLLLLVS